MNDPREVASGLPAKFDALAAAIDALPRGNSNRVRGRELLHNAGLAVENCNAHLDRGLKALRFDEEPEVSADGSRVRVRL